MNLQKSLILVAAIIVLTSLISAFDHWKLFFWGQIIISLLSVVISIYGAMLKTRLRLGLIFWASASCLVVFVQCVRLLHERFHIPNDAMLLPDWVKAAQYSIITLTLAALVAITIVAHDECAKAIKPII